MHQPRSLARQWLRTEGAHRLFVNPTTGKAVWVTVHGDDAGKLENRILRDAGVV